MATNSQPPPWSALRPIVLEQISLLEFMHFILKHHAAPTTLIVCSTRAHFFQQLRSAAEEEAGTTPANDQRPAQEGGGGGEDGDGSDDEPATVRGDRIDLITPTLRLISLSRSVRLAFCPSPHHLHAYLSSLRHATSASPGPPPPPPSAAESAEYRRRVPIIALLNPLAAHRDTSAFSGQGLSRTFAAAVSAASATGRKLVVAECAGSARGMRSATQRGLEGANEEEEEAERMLMDVEDDERAAAAPVAPLDPWSEQVGILNVTTKTFGAGERGWVGRTVSLRRLAGRWCRFVRLQDGAGING